MAYETLAYITSGGVEGSIQLQVQAVQSDGTVVYVYDASAGLLGSATLSNNTATVNLSRPLIRDEAIAAFVGDFGEKSGGAVRVMMGDELPTGWLRPLTATPIDIATYEATTGYTLPDVYDPEKTNRTPTIDAAAVLNLTSIGFDVDVLQGDGTATLSIRNVKGAAGVVYKFDSDAASNISTKTYNSNTTATVRVQDAANATRFLERTIGIVIAAATTSTIWGISYILARGGQDVLQVQAYCNQQLQVRIVGVFGAWTDCEGAGNNMWRLGIVSQSGTYIGTITPGTYNLEFRQKNNTALTKTEQCILTF